MSARQIPLICSGHSRPVPDLHYSPITEDGFFLISACLDGKPMIRNGETGDWIGTFQGHKGAVWCARLNSNATLALTGSADYTARLWDAVTGSELRSFTHTRIVKAVGFSQDSRRIVTAGQEKQLRVWNVEQGTQEGTLPGHNGTVRTVSWIGEHTVVSAGQDEVVRVWDLRSMSQSTSCVAKAPVMSLEVSWDGKYITTAAGKEVTFWDAASFAPLKVYTLNIDLNSASLHPSATRFVAGGSDFYVHVYSFETGEEQEVHKGHHGPVHSVSFAPDGETYSSGSEDGTIRIWQNSIKPYGLWSSNHSQSPSHSSHSSHSSHTHNHVYSHSPSHTVHSHSPSHTPPKR